MSDIDTLRRAAAKARELADGAPRGRWWPDLSPDFGAIVATAEHPDDVDCGGSAIAFFAYPDDVDRRTYQGGFDAAQHVALWDPAVALAVASWLELTAETPAFKAFAEGRAGSHVGKNIRSALVVARALLREVS